jgi:ribosomal subunit interface protein
MRIDIKQQEIHDWEPIRRYVTERLRFVLSRFGGQITRVGVRLSRIQTEAGAFHMECRLTLRLASGGKMQVQVSDVDAYAAIDRAAERARRVVNLRFANPRAATQAEL